MLRRDPRVSRKEHPKLLVLQDERDRIVVDGVLTADEWHRWADEREGDAIVCSPCHSGPRLNNWYVIRPCRSKTIVIGVPAILLPSVSNFRYANFSQNRTTAADMIAVRNLGTRR